MLFNLFYFQFYITCILPEPSLNFSGIVRFLVIFLSIIVPVVYTVWYVAVWGGQIHYKGHFGGGGGGKKQTFLGPEKATSGAIGNLA
jgi:hypothetical protein